MTDEEKTAIKAACVKAAARLVTTWWRTMRNGDVAPTRVELDGTAIECARVAGVLYTHVSGIDWAVSPKALPPGSVHRPRASRLPTPKP